MLEPIPRIWKPWRPANGGEGIYFMGKFCNQCRRNPEISGVRDPEAGNSDLCSILLRSLLHDLRDVAYPKEWIANGPLASDAKCTAFEPKDGGIQ